MYSLSGQIKFWLTWVCVLGLAYGTYVLREIILLIIVSLIMSLAIESMIVTLTRWFKHRIIAILIWYGVLLVCMLTGIVLIIPLVIWELTQIAALVVNNFENIRSQLQLLGIKWYIASLERVPSYIQQIFFQALEDKTIASQLQTLLTQNISDIVTTSSGYISNIGSFAVWFVSNFVSIMFQVGLCFILAIFFSVEKDALIHFVASLFPAHRHTYVIAKIEHLYSTMWLWLKGQLALCIVMAIVVWLFLAIIAILWMNLNHIFSLALIAGFTEFIPYIWPLLWAIPAVLIATMMFGFKGLLVVWLWYFCLQRLENNIFIPLVMKKTIGVNPLLIFLSMICAGVMMWLIGVILAVPIAQIITIIYHEYMWYKARKQQDQSISW